MNLPNKLTVLRVILIPFFLASVLWFFKGHMIVALVFFALASITDFLDGKIARKQPRDYLRKVPRSACR